MRPIKGYECRYFIDTFGNVYSCSRGNTIVLKPMLWNSGYYYVNFYPNGKQKPHSIHRLVAMTYLSNWDPKLQVNHINGIKTDNRLENLEMVTRSENAKHAHLTGLVKPKCHKGENHPGSKLCDNDINTIRKLGASKKYKHREIAFMYNVSRALISHILRGVLWNHLK